MKRFRLLLAPLLAPLLVLGFAVRCGAAAEPEAGPFAEAIAYAQARCVKIYGAGIGRGYGYATGVIVSPDGLILTAQGVYLASDRLRVVLPDGETHLAQVERRSQSLQAALLRINAKTPDFFELPDRLPVQQGDWVLAVSNLYKVAEGPEPLSVNLGVVSLRTRLEAKRGTQTVPYDGDVLVIDAITSNPGAPGGALVDTQGRLVGMLGKIIESVSTNTKLNYAAPADLLKKFVEGQAEAVVIKPSGKAEIGIQLFTLGGKRAPAYIDRVLPGSPADKAGLQKDDLVLSLGGDVVRTVADYQKAAGAVTPGQEIALVVKRKQEVLTIRLTPEGESPVEASE